MSTVLVVDDKEMMRDSVASTLQRAGLTVLTAPDGQVAMELIARRRPDAVVTDLRMPGLTGIELLERVAEIDDDLPVIVMTAYAAVDSAVKAMKLGAFDYITKPFEGDELVIAVKRAVNHARVIRENAVLRASVEPQQRVNTTGTTNGEPGQSGCLGGLDRLLGDSPAIRRVKEQVIAVADSQGTVLVCGESGSGKEVIARATHELSSRSSGPFLAVNCAALSESLLESELFGHERGAFTGAESLRKGRFELADGGTILLDEVSEIGPKVQAKLLRVLQERSFERVGSSLTIGIDVRVIATSNRDLPHAVAAGDFRQDLFFRLNVLPIHLPPLRDRPEDIPTLVRHFVEQIARREGRSAISIDGGALALMQEYAWPGNVRELQNICERAVVLAGCRGRKDEPTRITREQIQPWLIQIHHASSMVMRAPFGANMFEPKPSASTAIPSDMVSTDSRSLEDIEREVILQTLSRNNGHRQRTAKQLEIGVRTLGLKLKKWKEQELIEQSV